MRKMQSMFRNSSHELPGLNMASMPDLIFTVLFFFMIVTHMRHDDVRVQYDVPTGTEVRKLEQKASVVNLYIGKDQRIQVNGQMTDLSHLSSVIQAQRKKMDAENAEHLTISMKADRHTPMGLISDVKKQLQKSFALRVNYSGRDMNKEQ